MEIDFQKFKTDLSTEQVIEVVESLGGDINMSLSTSQELIFSSILYHIGDADRHKFKMYYYIDSCSFHDYKLGESFDIYELVMRVKEEYDGVDYNARNAVFYIANTLGIAIEGKNNLKESKTYNYLGDIGKYTKKNRKKIEKVVFDNKELDIYNNWYHQKWIDDGISVGTMEKYNIKYCDWNNSIVIPCYDEDFELIGARERTIDDDADWRYMPLTKLDKTYKFETGNYLYGLNNTQDAIRKTKKAILCEAEKSSMQGDTMFGKNNIIVGLFGSSFHMEQLKKLLALGINEIIIAFDYDYEEVGEGKKWEVFLKKVYRVADMCAPYVDVVSAMVLYGEHELKCSPTDLGKQKFLDLFKNRETIYERK